MIPARFIRTVPDRSEEQYERWWRDLGDLHPLWEFVTYRDPLDPRQFPLTSPHWHRSSNGAQTAGLVRLEALYHHGGIYVDSDVQGFRSFAPLLTAQVFAGWEDARCVPDAIIGAEAGHPAIATALDLAIERIVAGGDAWQTGPGVTTTVFPGRADVLLLPPGSLYPYHYREKHRAGEDFKATQPWCFAAHHWAGSWLTDAQRKALASPRR